MPFLLVHIIVEFNSFFLYHHHSYIRHNNLYIIFAVFFFIFISTSIVTKQTLFQCYIAVANALVVLKNSS